MTMTPVKSSTVKAVGHDPATNTMDVQFHSGEKVYTVPNVSAEQHQAFMNAPSKGKHFYKYFRGKSAK